MSLGQFSIGVHINFAAGHAKLDYLLETIKPKTILDLIGARWLSYIDQSFTTRGRGAWPPLAQSTLDMRERGGNAPLQDRGTYRADWTVKQTDSKTFLTIGNNIKTAGGIPLASIHEGGTGPYVIAARRAKVLAAKTRFGSWFFFGKQVNHPGLPARPVLPTAAEAERMAVTTINEMFEITVKNADAKARTHGGN